MKRSINPLDLVRSKDGSISLTKLAAATAHALCAVLFVRQQWNGAFNEAQWLIYMSATIFHASYDKTVATVKDFKDRASASSKRAAASSPAVDQ